jgi:hypothetical protein
VITALILRFTSYSAYALRARAVIALLGGRCVERSHIVATSTVPSPLEVDIAEHKLGLFLSDLELIESAVRKLLEPMTPEEYLALDDDELRVRLAALPSPTVEELTPLLVLAVDLESDAHDLVERAAKLSASVMTLIHQARDHDLLDKDSWADYRAGVAAWHTEAAAFYGGAS